jgi:hypothetical protein
MDEDIFRQLLSKYPVVRGRDAVNVGRARASASGAAGGAIAGHSGARGALADGVSATSSSSSSLLAASVAAAAAPVPVAPKDFWAGLQSLLERHYGPERAKAVASKFDEMHYASLRGSSGGLNYEDVEELARVMLEECAAEEQRRE